MKPEDIVEGGIYWSLRPTIEAEDCAEAYADTACGPRRPWYGKAHRGHADLWRLSCFSKETGKIDHDTNATAVIAHPETQLYLTQEDAEKAYAAARLRWEEEGPQWCPDYF